MRGFLKLAAILVLTILLAQTEICWAEMYVMGTETAGVTTVVKALGSIPTITHKAKITVRGGAISWFADGQTPTRTNGNVLSDGGTIELECKDEMEKFLAVMASGESGVSIFSGESGVSLYGHYLGNR